MEGQRQEQERGPEITPFHFCIPDDFLNKTL
jgi:hypothetical protein